MSLEELRLLYGADLFYAWLGLDNGAVYAAHKAAGGLTSVYRQLGVGCERLFKAILSQEPGLSDRQLHWEYEYEKPNGGIGIHTLDARIELKDLDRDARARVSDWLQVSPHSMGRRDIDTKGVVFEVRQAK